MNYLKVLIAIDSFKGCASSYELAQQIKKGILEVYKDAQVAICPIADGGEGTVEALCLSDGAKLIYATCKDPLGDDIEATYAILKDNVGVIEMASASGLTLVPVSKRNPSIATTYGTGDLIKDAIKKGVREFIIGIGGSATNDAGLGMLRSLGFIFLDKLGNKISLAKDLGKIVKIDKSRTLRELKECKFMVACDVNNPLFGKNGASHIYAKQKGANKAMILELDEQLRLFSEIVKKDCGKGFANCNGSGAAGGLGFGFLSFLNSELKSGIKIILERLEIESKIKDVDFVITGEGKIDKQSSMGKVIHGVGSACKKHNIPCIALSGNVNEANLSVNEIGITAYFSILNSPLSLSEATNKQNTLRLIAKESEQLFRLVKALK